MPEFETDDDRTYFLIRLPAHPGTLLEETETSGKRSGKIISLMRENPQVTIPEIAAALDRTTRAIEKQISKLKEAGLIERIGPAKGGHWVVKDKKGKV